MARGVKVSIAKALFQNGKERNLRVISSSSVPSDGEIPSREAFEGHFVVQSRSVCGRAHNFFQEGEEMAREVQVSDTRALSQYGKHRELRDTSGPSDGENPGREASASHYGVQVGSSSGDTLADPEKPPALEGDVDYVDDIVLSAARHFSNRFLQRIRGLSIQSLLGQRDQLVEAIKRVSNFNVDCSTFVSQIENLVHHIDEFKTISGGSESGSLLAEQGAAIQQFKDQLNMIDSEDAHRQERLEAIQGQLQSIGEAEDVLIANQAEVLQALVTITENARRLANERKQFATEVVVLEEEGAQSQQLRVELQGQIEQAEQELKMERFRREHLHEQLRTAMGLSVLFFPLLCDFVIVSPC